MSLVIETTVRGYSMDGDHTSQMNTEQEGGEDCSLHGEQVDEDPKVPMEWKRERRVHANKWFEEQSDQLIR